MDRSVLSGGDHSPLPPKRETMKKKLKKIVRVNPIAKDLRTPKYHLRVPKCKKVYDRKRLPKVKPDADYGGVRWN